MDFLKNFQCSDNEIRKLGLKDIDSKILDQLYDGL